MRAVGAASELTSEIITKMVVEQQKQTEKSIIQASIASSTLSKMQGKQSKIENSERDIMSVTKASVQNVTSDLERSLKGAWGKKAKETFQTNATKFDTF